VKRVLLTGMSATGKSTIVRALAARGYKAIDADDGWTEPLPDGTRRWREDAIGELLDTEDAQVLFLAGCEENQVRFLLRFDEVILLSAPRDALLSRLETRTENPFGKSLDERDRILRDLETVEPRLRAIADHEIRTTGSVDDAVRSILALVDTPFGIHPLRRDDLALVSEVLTHRSPHLHRERLERQEHGVFTYLIAWQDSRPIGHVGIDWPHDRHPERMIEWGPERPLVHDLEVAAAHRNHGVGRALMIAIETRVRTRGMTSIGLGTGLRDHYAAARHLYRRLGYVERPGTLHIVSARSPWDAPGQEYIDALTYWQKDL
jgi:dephospho-CoA kinase/GNAT superfamily N-acetyltransferase